MQKTSHTENIHTHTIQEKLSIYPSGGLRRVFCLVREATGSIPRGARKVGLVLSIPDNCSRGMAGDVAALVTLLGTHVAGDGHIVGLVVVNIVVVEFLPTCVGLVVIFPTGVGIFPTGWRSA